MGAACTEWTATGGGVDSGYFDKGLSMADNTAAVGDRVSHWD